MTDNPLLSVKSSPLSIVSSLQYTVSSEKAPYISKHGYATCQRRSSSAGERLTNMREAVSAAHSTAGIANSAGKLPLHQHSAAQVPKGEADSALPTWMLLALSGRDSNGLGSSEMRGHC